MELSSIYFPVEKVPSDIIAPGFEFPSGINNAVVITKPDGKKRVVGYCSEIYNLVKNEDVVPAFMQEMSKNWDVTTKVRSNGYSTFFVDFILNGQNIKVTPVDTIAPRITLVNSYDQSLQYHFMAGFHRKVCTNGLTIPVGTQSKIKKLHTPALSELTSFDAILEMTGKFLENAEQLSEVYRELASRPIRKVLDRIEEVVEETKFPTSLMEDVMEVATKEAMGLENGNITDWLVYNAFNYQLNHNSEIKTKEIKREQIDQEILTYLMNY